MSQYNDLLEEYLAAQTASGGEGANYSADCAAIIKGLAGTFAVFLGAGSTAWVQCDRLPQQGPIALARMTVQFGDHGSISTDFALPLADGSVCVRLGDEIYDPDEERTRLHAALRAALSKAIGEKFKAPNRHV